MLKLAGIVALVLAILISGCQTKWIKLDRSPIVEAEFQKARAACRVDEKLARLDQVEAERSDKLVRARTNEAKMLVKDDFATEVRAVYAEIDTCMQQQGYQKEG